MVEKLKDPEFRQALPFAVVGGLQGAFNYYVKPELTLRRGAFLAGSIIALAGVRVVGSNPQR